MTDIQSQIYGKLNAVVQAVTLRRLRGAAMIGSVVLPIFLLFGAGVMSDPYSNTGGDSLGPGLFALMIILTGMFSGWLVSVLTASIHAVSDVRAWPDYIELVLSLVGAMALPVWLFGIPEAISIGIASIVGIVLLYVVIIVRFIYHAHLSFSP